MEKIALFSGLPSLVVSIVLLVVYIVQYDIFRLKKHSKLKYLNSSDIIVLVYVVLNTLFYFVVLFVLSTNQ